jgi:sugar lactone lactonase YvrE
MKKTLLLPCVSMLFAFCGAHAQNCTVNITGTNCTGSQLTANTAGGTLSSLTWYHNGTNVFGADTVSSQASISVVAGNHGSGAGSSQFGFPAGGIAVDASGNIYVADVQNHRVQKWAPGAVTGITVAGGNGAGSAANQLNRPKDVFVDAGGNLYIADENNQRIQKWAPGATSGITVAGGNGAGSAAQQFNSPEGVYVDAAGNIYVADKYNYRIQRWAPGAASGVTVAGGNGFGSGADQFNYPVDVYLDAANNIYVADINTESSDYHRVQKWAPGAASGVTIAGGSGQFGFLLAIYVDADGTLYTTDNGISGTPVSRVQKWLPGAGVGVTVAGGHSSGWDVLSYPTGVALSNGAIYVLDGTTNPRVQKYIPTNGIVDRKFTPTQTGSYTVQAVFKNGCIAQSSAVVVRSIPGKPQIYPTQRGGTGNLCEGGIDTFFVAAWDDVTSYAWKIPASCTVVANKNDSIIISVPAGFTRGLLGVRGTNFCGAGTADTIQLLGKPLKPFKIYGPQQVFANQTNIAYSVDDNYNNTYNWIVPAGATITSGQGTAGITVNWGASAGIVSVNASNACGTSARKALSVALKTGSIAAAQDASGLKTISNNAQVFPNPAKAIVTIRFNAAKETKATIELQDLHGKVLMRKMTFINAGINNISLDISKYAGGMYFISVVSPQEKIRLKLNKE